MAKILIADDHVLVRAALARYLSAATGDDIFQANTLPTALNMMAESGPFDLVLLDYTMPGMSLPAGLARAIKANAQQPVALLSGTAPPEVARRALAAGACGFVPKTIGPECMIAAIAQMIAGEIFRPDDFFAPEAGTRGPATGLTPRETDVLRGISAGQSNKEIARNLDIQEVTIKLHVKTICRKLQARNRTHAAMLARDQALLPPPRAIKKAPPPQ